MSMATRESPTLATGGAPRQGFQSIRADNPPTNQAKQTSTCRHRGSTQNPRRDAAPKQTTPGRTSLGDPRRDSHPQKLTYAYTTEHPNSPRRRTRKTDDQNPRNTHTGHGMCKNPRKQRNCRGVGGMQPELFSGGAVRIGWQTANVPNILKLDKITPGGPEIKARVTLTQQSEGARYERGEEKPDA